MNEATEQDGAITAPLPRTRVEPRIATPDGAATAHAMVLEIAAHEDSLPCVVREEARNRGVGRNLMSAIARVADRDALTVVWGARPDTKDGHRFYRRLGATLNATVVATWSPENYRWATA